MVGEHMESFIQGLIDKTKENVLKWESLYTVPERYDIDTEIKKLLLHPKSYCIGVLFRSSYMLRHKNGYIILCDVAFLNIETGNPSKKLFVFTQISPDLPLNDSGNYPGFQAKLGELKLIIEKDMSHEYHFPDALYSFWSDIINDR